MKRCPQCHRVESDETLKFCRTDGAVLVEDSAVSDQFSATKVLPSSPTGGTQVVPTDPGHADVITAGLKPAMEPGVQAGELRSASHLNLSDSFVTRIKRHKAGAIIISALCHWPRLRPGRLRLAICPSFVDPWFASLLTLAMSSHRRT